MNESFNAIFENISKSLWEFTFFPQLVPRPEGQILDVLALMSYYIETFS